MFNAAARHTHRKALPLHNACCYTGLLNMASELAKSKMFLQSLECDFSTKRYQYFELVIRPANDNNCQVRSVKLGEEGEEGKLREGDEGRRTKK